MLDLWQTICQPALKANQPLSNNLQMECGYNFRLSNIIIVKYFVLLLHWEKKSHNLIIQANNKPNKTNTKKIEQQKTANMKKTKF